MLASTSIQISQFVSTYKLSIPCTNWLLADQPMQVSVEAYYNAIKPSFAGEDLLGDWTIRTQWQARFPK